MSRVGDTDSGRSDFAAAQKAFRRGLLYLVLSLIGFTMVLPFLWMLSTSLKTGKGATEVPPKWIPRESVTLGHIGDKDVRVHVLSETALVKRLDTGQELTVYAQALKTSHEFLWLWGKQTTTIPSVYAPYPAAPAQSPATPGRSSATPERSPVEVLSTSARVRVLEEGPDQYKVLDLPGSAVHTNSWLSPQWGNYPKTWNMLPFGRSFINTAIVTVSVTFGQVLTCSLAAFAFARLRFPGRDKIFFGYLATMMIPGAVTLIPVYIMFIKIPELLNFVFHTSWFSQDLYFLGKYYVGRLVGGNSYLALILPGLFSAYGTFMLRQFFMTLPRALEDAARVDGCGNLRVYWHVTLPLSKVAIATLATFTFMGTWKAFMWPLLILNTEELVPLQVLLQRFQGQYGAEYNLLMAGSVIVLIPLLIVFLLGQRYFIRGIQLGAVKG